MQKKVAFGFDIFKKLNKKRWISVDFCVLCLQNMEKMCNFAKDSGTKTAPRKLNNEESAPCTIDLHLSFAFVVCHDAQRRC